MADRERETLKQDLPPDLSADLRALRDHSARDLPPLAHIVDSVRPRRARAASTWKERCMSVLEAKQNRPWVAVAAVAAVVVAALVIPISYERTTAHRVSLALAGVTDPVQTKSIATELKSALHADQVAARLEIENGSPTLTLETSVPVASKVDVAAVAQAFAKNLRERGYQATASVEPVRERVSGSVYAYAQDLVIRVSTDGKTAAQIESEIRQRFADAGIPDAKVSVTDEGANQRKVTLEVERQKDGTSAEAEPAPIRLELTKDGQTLGGAGTSVEVRKIKTPTGTTLQLDVNKAGKTTAIEVPNVDTMSDAAIKAAIETQLRQAGFDNVEVTVTSGKVQVEVK